MKIAVISVSPRENSLSIKVARLIESQLQGRGVEVAFYSFVDFEVRSIKDDYIQPDEVTSKQQELLDIFSSGVEKAIWVVPEYNRLAPAEFVGFMTHFGTKQYPMLWNNVSHSVVGVSSGLGGRNALQYVQMVFNYMINATRGNAIVLPYHFQSANTGEYFDDKGEFSGDTTYLEGLERFLKLLLGEPV